LLAKNCFRSISTARLNPLRDLHLQPIKVVFYNRTNNEP